MPVQGKMAVVSKALKAGRATRTSFTTTVRGPREPCPLHTFDVPARLVFFFLLCPSDLP